MHGDVARTPNRILGEESEWICLHLRLSINGPFQLENGPFFPLKNYGPFNDILSIYIDLNLVKFSSYGLNIAISLVDLFIFVTLKTSSLYFFPPVINHNNYGVWWDDSLDSLAVIYKLIMTLVCHSYLTILLLKINANLFFQRGPINHSWIIESCLAFFFFNIVRFSVI